MPFLRSKDPVNQTSKDFALRKPLVTIGRKTGNDIVLEDSTIAASHANLIRKGGVYSVHISKPNLEIYLNGTIVKEAEFKVGDRLLVGRYELTMVDGEPETVTTETTGQGHSGTLKRLVEFSTALMRSETSDKLFKRLLESVVELTAAEKGFVIVLRDGERQLAAHHNVGSEALDISRISDTILEQVIETRRPMIVSDALNDRQFRKARSVVDLKLSSVMCVPLLYRNDMLGVLYLGNDAITGLFTESDLSVLKIWATQASMVVHTALVLNELKTSNRNLRERLRQTGQGSIIGSCGPMKNIYRTIRKIAPTDLSALVLGETGTGKELVARDIHRLSDRARKPFVSINCGAIPENLLESELFGHKKGSFTGALSDKIGKFEAANGGTLFLDEIGEMPMPLQVKLLRVLQERAIERIGELKPRPVDIRVISATNKNLEEEIREGRFREDLFYRLNEVSLNLPPLRERGDDIHEIAKFFLNKYAEQYTSRVRGFNNDAIKAMAGYYWPGNVRQLENRVKKAVIMTDRALVNNDDLGIADSGLRSIQPLDIAAEEFKKNYIHEALVLNNWNKAQTARDLGVDPRTIFRYIEKLEE